MTIKFSLIGATGRVGRAFMETAEAAADFELVGAMGLPEPDLPPIVWRGKRITVTESPEEAVADAEVVIDFSRPEALRKIIPVLQKKSIPLVTGTTGLGPDDLKIIETAAEKIAVVQEFNMSLGVNLLAHLVRRAAKIMGDDYDIDVQETHHRGKADAPSGTAIMLAKAGGGQKDESGKRTAMFPFGKVGVSSSRAGTVFGEHSVFFSGPDERIELSHRAYSRAIFVRGAFLAARYLLDKPPGRYGMEQVLGID
ncbi:4-hydroxy-tetrahydrodipicolinate reductase [candidate division KSB1 bacterium]